MIYCMLKSRGRGVQSEEVRGCIINTQTLGMGHVDETFWISSYLEHLYSRNQRKAEVLVSVQRPALQSNNNGDYNCYY